MLENCCYDFFFQAEDGIRVLVRSRGLGDVYKRQVYPAHPVKTVSCIRDLDGLPPGPGGVEAEGVQHDAAGDLPVCRMEIPYVPGSALPHGPASGQGGGRPGKIYACLLYTSPSPRDRTRYRMPSSA